MEDIPKRRDSHIEQSLEMVSRNDLDKNQINRKIQKE